jgi:hypothetical protein
VAGPWGRHCLAPVKFLHTEEGKGKEKEQQIEKQYK